MSSTYLEGAKFYERSFEMGSGTDIIINETVAASQSDKTGSRVEICGIKSVKFPHKGLEPISRVLVERLLPYFVDKERVCPRVTISEAATPSDNLSLNDYLGSETSQIVEMNVQQRDFTLSAGPNAKTFQVRIFKLFSPRAEKSKVSLVGHRREVTSNPLQQYIPEFADEFFEPNPDDATKGRNFIIKAYVFGDYLNENVSLERGEFRFQTDADLLEGVSQTDIEHRAAMIAQTTVGDEVAARRERKRARVSEYVETQAPWHRTLANGADISTLSMHPSHQEIELYFQKQKYEKETSTRARVAEVLKSENAEELAEKIAHLMRNISDTSKNDLIHYVSMRKCVLDLFSKSLELDADGKHKLEGDAHDIIMRRRTDCDDLDYEEHNLWILDERLNFSSYVSSDKPLGNSNRSRTDISIFSRRVAFRGENEPSNPITIFEFKKPQRDDFADRASKDNPVHQIVRYVNDIRDGRFKTPQGRDILVTTTTPFYGYVVCDLTTKVKEWIDRVEQFTPMPDGLGWFRWFPNISLYMEVVSFTKLLRDAEMRNKIFFKHLGIV